MTERPQTNVERTGSRGFRVALFILLTLAIALRIFGAWCFAYSASSDHGIACLMAKHIAEGRIWPVFYYGQPYMGSLEPFVSSLFCRVFGFSGFAVNLGTALAGILLLPFIYLWGRDAGGRSGGLASLTLCLIGSLVFYQYQCWSYGGYAMLVLISTALLWLTARTIEKKRRQMSTHLHYVVLGLLAGVGWWTSQLITQTLIAAALLYIVVLRRKAFHRKVLSALPAFVAGSLPFWIWNWNHDWATLRYFAGSTGRSEFGAGLRRFFTDSFFAAIGIGDTPPPFRSPANVLSVIVPALILIALAVLIGEIRRNGLRGTSIHLLAAFLLLATSATFFAASTSRFAAIPAGRYMLPLFPAIAVLIGRATGHLDRRLPFKLGWLPLLLMVGFQAVLLTVYLAWGTSGPPRMKTVRDFGALLRRLDINTVYAPFTSRGPNHSLNYLLNEEFVFSDPCDERYPPYAEQVELAARTAVLCNYDHFDDFLESTGGSAATEGVEAHYVSYNAKAPDGGLEEISPQRWTAATDPRISDGNVGTFWHPSGTDGEKDWLEVGFREEFEITAIRIISRTGRYPGTWQVQAADASGAWRDVTPEMSVRRYFWSGPKFYRGGRTYRVECRFPPEQASAIRIRVAPAATEIAELQIFSPGTAADYSVDELMTLIEKRGLKNVYSDRWLANLLYQRDLPGVRVFGEPSILSRTSSLLPSRIEFTPDTGFVVNREDAPMTRRVLSAAGVDAEETSIAQRIVFDEFSGDLSGAPELFWTGRTCVTRHREPVDATPQTAVKAVFEKGIQFLGLSISRPDPVAESDLAISYYWRCPATVTIDDLVTFVHFKGPGNSLFQDDHALLEHVDTSYQRKDEVLVEKRTMRIPADAIPGEYEIALGIYDSRPPHKRLSVETDLNVRRQAVVMPVLFTVSRSRPAR
ncbi:MAG: glycosyltransferase family 39 protein [Verrucomicrobia bacterium]|nr:glycosyltransferase family 39 protein [Verrucomicrobiota bacterium]